MHPLTFLDEWARQQQDGQQRPPPPQPPPPSQLSPPSAVARSHSSSSKASLQPSPQRRARTHAAPVRATAEPSSPPEGGAPPRPSTAPPLTPPVSTPVVPCSPEHATSACSKVSTSFACSHHAPRWEAAVGRGVGREAEAAAVLTAMMRRRCRLEAEVRPPPKKNDPHTPNLSIPHLGHPRPCTRATPPPIHPPPCPDSHPPPPIALSHPPVAPLPTPALCIGPCPHEQEAPPSPRQPKGLVALKASPRAEVLAAATLRASGCNPRVLAAATPCTSGCNPLGMQVPHGEAAAAVPARTRRVGETGQVRCVWITRARAQEAAPLGSPAAAQCHRARPPHKQPPQRRPRAHSTELKPSPPMVPSSTPPPPTDAGHAWAPLCVPSLIPAVQGRAPIKRPSPPPRTAKGPSRPQSARGAKGSDPLFLYTFTGLCGPTK